VAIVMHEIMTELTKAVSEADRIMVLTILVLTLMQQNGSKNSQTPQNHSNSCK
jgi:hypothetical protein